MSPSDMPFGRRTSTSLWRNLYPDIHTQIVCSTSELLSLRFNNTLSTAHPLLISQRESVLGAVINQTKSRSLAGLRWTKNIMTNYNICTKILGHWFAGFLPHLKEIQSLTASDKNPVHLLKIKNTFYRCNIRERSLFPWGHWASSSNGLPNDCREFSTARDVCCTADQ